MNFYATSIDSKHNEEILYSLSTKDGSINEVLRTKGDLVGILGDLVILVDQNSYDSISKDKNPNPHNVSGGLKDENELLRTVIAFDVKEKKRHVLLKLLNADLEGYEDIHSIFLFPKQNKLLIQLGVYESGDYTGYRKIVFNLDTKKITKSNLPLFVENFKGELRWGIIHNINFTDNEYIYSENFILDKNFQIQGLCLTKSTSRLPIYFKEDGLSFVPSVLDQKQSKNQNQRNVIIPINPSYIIERSLFSIYYDSAIKAKDVRSLTIDDLYILKNMVFAKHNYKFDLEYYQAFFNLFSFYNSDRDRKTRTKEVNHLLTEMDKKNLQLIDATLNKLKR